MTFGKFSEAIVPIDECLEFLEPRSAFVDGKGKQQRNRPFIWLTACQSLDGMLSFNEKDHTGPAGIALRHCKETSEDCAADWRLLNCSWALADAVLLSAAVIRAEPEFDGCYCRHEDLSEYRKSRYDNCDLQRQYAPLHVIITSSGNLDPKHCIFRKLQSFANRNNYNTGDINCLIATTEGQLVDLRGKFAHYTNVQVKQYGSDTRVNLKTLAIDLFETFSVQTLDCNAGGRVAEQLVRDRLLDELRLTITGQLVGPQNSLGELRTALFPCSGENYFGADDNPHVHFDDIRVFGNQFLFIRGHFYYRH